MGRPGAAKAGVIDTAQHDCVHLETGLFACLAAGALRRHLANFQDTAGHRPETVILPLDEQNPSAIVEDSGVTAGVWSQVDEVAIVEFLDFIRVTDVMRAGNLRRNPDQALASLSHVGIVAAPEPRLVCDTADLIRPDVQRQLRLRTGDTYADLRGGGGEAPVRPSRTNQATFRAAGASKFVRMITV